MEKNLGSQGRTQGTRSPNTGERDPQQGLDSLDEQGIGTEGQDIMKESTDTNA
jgi:hypothetical protein